jgi:putative transposase
MSQMMTIVPNSKVEVGEKTYRITHILDFEAVLAENLETGRAERLFIKDISPFVNKNKKDLLETKDREIGVITDDDWREAQRRFSIIRPLLNTGIRTKESVAVTAKENNVHYTTIYRWIRTYENEGRISSLVPTKSSGGKGGSRLKAEVEEILKITIEDFYLSKQQRSMQQTCTEVERRCRNAGIESPHPNTIRNRITALTDRIKIERRRGKQSYRDTYAPIISHFPGADYPLSVVQIDHTKVDIILVDEVDRRPIGRPWITLAIDVFSRMVFGFYVSFDPPSAMSVGLCFSHAILPKDKWLAKFDINTPWHCWGMPKTIHADNAKEFRGSMLIRACQEHSIDLQWRPVATPHWGGHIERLLGTFLSEIHRLRGTTFSNIQQRGEYKSEKEAVFTLSEFEKWLTTYIVEIYHQKLHSGIKTTPARKYEDGIFGSKNVPGIGLPARIIDAERLRLDFMPFVERKIKQYGVVIDEIHYYHDVLRRFINAPDPEYPERIASFIFRRDPRDLSVIYFFDPELNQYFPIPYRDTSRPAISVWELREVRKRLKDEGHEQVNEHLIFEAYEKLRNQEETSHKNTKKAKRRKESRNKYEQTKNVVNFPVVDEKERFDSSNELNFDIQPFDDLDEFL